MQILISTQRTFHSLLEKEVCYFFFNFREETRSSSMWRCQIKTNIIYCFLIMIMKLNMYIFNYIGIEIDTSRALRDESLLQKIESPTPVFFSFRIECFIPWKIIIICFIKPRITKHNDVWFPIQSKNVWCELPTVFI